MSTRIKIAAVLLVTVACLVWVLWGIEIEVVGSALERFRWWAVLPMLALYFSAHVVRCYRLRLLMDVRLGLWPLLSVNSIGFLAINVVPFRLGELVRPYLFLEKHDIPLGTSLAAIFAERVLDMLSLLVMLLLVGVVVDIPPGGVEVAGVDLVRAGQTMAGVISLLACDSGLVQGCPWVYEPWEEFKLPNSVHGGGGTDFRPVFEWVARQGQRPELLVYFTDAQGSFPQGEPDYPVIWLVKGRTPVPWGQRIQLN